MSTQLQRQVQMTRDQTILAEIQYTVQKDLDNFLGIMIETMAVTQSVRRDDPLYLIHINRLIAQFNLSSSIHYDTQQNCQHNGSDGLLKEQKGVSLKILEEFLQWAKIKPVQEIEQLLNDYKNILQTPQVTINMRNLHRTNTNGLRKDEQLNLQKLLEAMPKIDDDYAKIRNGEQVQLEDKQQLFNKVSRRYQIAQQKIQIYLTLNNNNNPIQNSQQMFGNPIEQNNNLNYNQNNTNGIGNGFDGGYGGGSNVNAHGQGFDVKTNAVIYEYAQPDNKQVQQNIINSNNFQQNINNPILQVNENQQKIEEEQQQLRDNNNNKQLIQYSPDMVHIIKTIIFIIQQKIQDIQKIFSFISQYQQPQKQQILQELKSFQQLLTVENKIGFIIYSIQVSINTDQPLNLQTSDFEITSPQDVEILNQVISQDFK